jgi:hypothetical protein
LTEPGQQAPEASAPQEERRLALPAWVPAAIGLTLVLLAAMAVYTGFRTQVRPLERSRSLAPFAETDGLYPEESGGSPGAPGPGGSRVTPEGEVPTPEPLGGGDNAGLAIEGDATGLVGRRSLAARRGVVFDVDPPDAVIWVNDVAVGAARQFASVDQAYEFAEEGVFTIRVTAPRRAEIELEVSADHGAEEEIARITIKLPPSR